MQLSHLAVLAVAERVVASTARPACTPPLGNCFASRCCSAPTHECFLRKGANYAQCRHARDEAACGDTAEWLCPPRNRNATKLGSSAALLASTAADSDGGLPQATYHHLSQDHDRIIDHLNRSRWDSTFETVWEQQHYATLLPLLDRARRVTLADFPAERKIDVHDDPINGSITGDFKIFSVAHALPEWLGAIERLDMPRAMRALHSTVKAALEHLHAPGRRHLTLDDVTLQGLLFAAGIVGPVIHWDPNWETFPHAAGFNLWCLLEEHVDPGEGNMFLFRTKELAPTDGAVSFSFNENGHVYKENHMDNWLGTVRPSTVLKIYDTVEQINFEVTYLEMRPGECVVFSKRTLHQGDIRPHARGVPVRSISRRAMSVRVAIHAEGSNATNIWPYSHIYGKLFQKKRIGSYHGIPQAEIGLDELLYHNLKRPAASSQQLAVAGLPSQ